MVASLLGSAAQAEVKGRLAEQLQVALHTRVLIEQAKGALMVHQDIDEATAFEWLRLSARSTSRTVNAVAQDILAGRWPPMPDLAAVVGRLAQARRTEQRAHQRAIDLHEQAADQHAHRVARTKRKPTATAQIAPEPGSRTRWPKNTRPAHDQARVDRAGQGEGTRIPDRPAGMATRPPRHTPEASSSYQGRRRRSWRAAPAG